MVNIDYIMQLIDWNNSIKKQLKGIKLAQDVKCINVFLQPSSPYGKNTWENCAKILSEKTDKELSPYLIDLMEWLQDMNWPGAFCICERLQRFRDEPLYHYSYKICLKYAKALEDDVWESNLKMIERKNGEQRNADAAGKL